jgi:hypothetical protein
MMAILPEEIKTLPDDAVGVDIERTYKEENGAAKTCYKLVYKLKDGSERTEEKEYEGEN